MLWFEEPDEQKVQQWQSRIAQKRLDLSASVEATLGDSSLPSEEEEWVEEATTTASVSKRVAIISPRLSLQSRPMLTVQPQPTAEPLLPSKVTDREQVVRPMRTVESGNMIARVAHRISSSLSSLERMPHNDGATTNFPLPHSSTGYSEHQQASAGKIPVARPSEVANHTIGKQGWIKRTTKVRLQVVPKLDTMQKDGISPFCDKATNPRVPTVQETEGRIETPPLTSMVTDRAALCGSGKFELGQSDIAIAHTLITMTSVVVVMLASDPGPVVVQYVSLQPTIGFTVHLSAPTKNATAFTYAIMLGESA